MTLKSELITNFQQRSKENRTFGVFWKLAKIFVGADRAIESLTDSDDLRELCQAITDGFNIELVCEQTPDWNKKGSKQAVLIFGPHTFHIEPYLLLSLMERKDVYFVAINSAKQLLPDTMKDRILTVTPTFMAKDAPRKPGIDGMLQSLRRALFTNNTNQTVAQIREANQQSLKRAAELLADGHVVMIFPAASGNMVNDRWYGGIGVILEQLEKQKKLEEVVMQPFAITKVSFKKLLREVRKRFVKQKMNEPKVELMLDWMTAYPASALPSAHNPKQMVEQVRQRYVLEFSKPT